MQISALITSLALAFEPAVLQIRALGFTYVDVVGLTQRSPSHFEALADSGLLVSCVALGRGLPEGVTLDAPDLGTRRRAVAEVQKQIADAARLGATHGYLVPGHDTSHSSLLYFGDACAVLADSAAARMMRLCVEHVPGRALPTVTAALQWLEQVDHENLALLLDVGHCLISEEDPARAVVQAGDRLGYVHLDDNDSVSDLHWPLLTGRLTAEMLEAVLTLLTMDDYNGGLALELNPRNADPVRALAEGRATVTKHVSEPGDSRDAPGK
jgi:sugar phosphate isomerase/epimerase